MSRHIAQRKKGMSHFEQFVNEGNEKACELAKEGAMLDQGFMAEARAETLQQEREYQAKSGRCGFVDQNLGRIAPSHCKKYGR